MFFGFDVIVRKPDGGCPGECAISSSALTHSLRSRVRALAFCLCINFTKLRLVASIWINAVDARISRDVGGPSAATACAPRVIDFVAPFAYGAISAASPRCTHSSAG